MVTILPPRRLLLARVDVDVRGLEEELQNEDFVMIGATNPISTIAEEIVPIIRYRL